MINNKMSNEEIADNIIEMLNDKEVSESTVDSHYMSLIEDADKIVKKNNIPLEVLGMVVTRILNT